MRPSPDQVIAFAARRKSVLELLQLSLSYKEIAETLGISHHDVINDARRVIPNPESDRPKHILYRAKLELYFNAKRHLVPDMDPELQTNTARALRKSLKLEKVEAFVLGVVYGVKVRRVATAIPIDLQRTQRIVNAIFETENIEPTSKRLDFESELLSWWTNNTEMRDIVRNNEDLCSCFVEYIQQRFAIPQGTMATIVISTATKIIVDEAWKLLDPREAFVMSHRFPNDSSAGDSLEDIAGLMDVSHEWVRQIEAKGLRKIQQHLESCHDVRPISVLDTDIASMRRAIVNSDDALREMEAKLIALQIEKEEYRLGLVALGRLSSNPDNPEGDESITRQVENLQKNS